MTHRDIIDRQVQQTNCVNSDWHYLPWAFVTMGILGGDGFDTALGWGRRRAFGFNVLYYRSLEILY